VRITAHDPEAVAAVHDFLRFQIREHQTGSASSTKVNRLPLSSRARMIHK
jgi:hypothetical protein